MAAAGLDPNATDREGNSALHLAAVRPNLIAFTALAECGANPVLPNAKGLTPLAIMERAVRPATSFDGMYRFIFEFQSRDDADMAERMAAYRIETVRAVRRRHPDLPGPDGRVPFTMGVVVHTGDGTWDAVTDAAELMDPSGHPGPGMRRLSSAYSVIDVLGTDFPDHPDNPAAAYFELLRGDPELSLRAARTLDRLFPLDKYRPLRRLLMMGVALGIDAES